MQCEVCGLDYEVWGMRRAVCGMLCEGCGMSYRYVARGLRYEDCG